MSDDNTYRAVGRKDVMTLLPIVRDAIDISSQVVLEISADLVTLTITADVMTILDRTKKDRR